MTEIHGEALQLQLQLQTQVLECNPTRFDLTGRALTKTLRDSLGVPIRPGLARRLRVYAEESLDVAGFLPLVSSWQPCVYTVDGDSTPSMRSYCVRFTNAQGGYIEVVGIFTRRGWPFLDHGYAVGQETAGQVRQ